MVISINPINSVLFLISTFFNTSIIFILLNVDFLGLLFIMVYVGAIAVLFLFIVMLLNIQKIEEDKSIYLTIGGVMLFIYILEFIFFIFYNTLNYFPIFFFSDYHTFLFTNISYLDEFNRFTIVKKIGILIYYEYFIYIIYSGLILLLAMIGSIYLTNEKIGYSMKHQENQLNRDIYILNMII
jgi:NADH-quinone oxidoreductase subunit J